MSDIIFKFICLFALLGGFCLLLDISEVIFNVAYSYIPAFKRWADDYMGK